MSLHLVTNRQTPLEVCCGEDVFLKQSQGSLEKDGDNRQLTDMQDNDPADTWGARHTDEWTKLLTMETQGGHRALRSQQAARNWSSGKELSLPKVVGFQTGHPGRGSPQG